MSLVNLKPSRRLLENKYIDLSKFYNKSVTDLDAGLLLALLEQMSDEERVHKKGDKVGQVHPLRAARAHALLLDMEDHDFNLFQASFFTPPNDKHGKLYIYNAIQMVASALCMCTFTLIVVTSILDSWYINGCWFKPSMEELQESKYDPSFNLTLIYLIAILATLLFWNIIGPQRKGFKKFVEFSQMIDQHRAGSRSYRTWCIRLDWFSNSALGFILWGLNPFFILSAETPLDAVLNAVATGFILEVDDYVRPLVWMNTNSHNRPWFDWDFGGIKDLINEELCDFVTVHNAKKWRELWVRAIPERKCGGSCQAEWKQFTKNLKGAMAFAEFNMRCTEKDLLLEACLEDEDDNTFECTFRFDCEGQEEVLKKWYDALNRFKCVNDRTPGQHTRMSSLLSVKDVVLGRSSTNFNEALSRKSSTTMAGIASLDCCISDEDDKVPTNFNEALSRKNRTTMAGIASLDWCISDEDDKV